MKTTFMSILIGISGSYGISFAQEGVILSDKSGWHKVAEKTVDFSRDRDEISVIGKDKFSAIKFIVTDATINLKSLEIIYETGNTQAVKINTPIKPAGKSRVIDLEGGERELRKIRFVYSTLPNVKDKKAHVQVWGRKTEAGRDKMGINTQPSGAVVATTSTPNPEENSNIPSPAIVTSDKTGWHKIGTRTVEFVKDRDEVMVIGANRFSSIKFKALDAPVNIMDVEMQYATGDNQKTIVGIPLENGQESKEILVDNGKERDLQKITFLYKTLPNRKDEKARVEIWGYKTNADQTAAGQ